MQQRIRPHRGRARLRLALLGMILAGLGAACARRQDQPAPSGSGFLEADPVTVSAETTGRLLRVGVEEGTRVRIGDTLAVIDPSRLEQDLAVASAALAGAEAALDARGVALKSARENRRHAAVERERIQPLVPGGSAPEQQLDRLEHESLQADLAVRAAEVEERAAEAQRERARAEVERIRRLLRDCHVLAPVAGTVIDRYSLAGELATPGKPIARLASLDTLTVKVYLPAPALATVRLGSRVTVSTESAGPGYQGTVIWTSQEAEFTPKNVQTRRSRTNLVYAVKVSVPNRDGLLKIGMPVFVRLLAS